MKIQIDFKRVLLVATILFGQLTPALIAQNVVPAPAAQTAQPAPVQLSADVWDVLRLAHANVNDATIIAYIRNSGKAYALGAPEILYLRDQGLSDQVVTAMLEQHRNVVAPNPPPAPQFTQPTQAPVWTDTGSSAQVAPIVSQPQPAPTYVQAAPVYAQPAPVYAYPSYGYYGYPYYGSYWGYPAVSLSFGWGGYYGHGYYGGYHGYYGGHYGGGYHGGGGHYGGGGHGGGGHH